MIEFLEALESTTTRVGRWYRRTALRLRGAQISDDLQCKGNFFEGAAVGFSAGKQLYLESYVKIRIGGLGDQCGRVSIGARVFMNCGSMVDSHICITIGDRVMIGPYAYICDFDHDIAIMEHGSIGAGLIKAAVVIEDDVWVGAGAMILKGVTIGKGAVVGAGAVVSKDVKAMEIVVGVPARVVGMRGVPKQVSLHEEAI